MEQRQEMYQRYIYEKSPLQEAIFEANFATDAVDDVTLPGLFFEKIAHDFPLKKNERENMIAHTKKIMSNADDLLNRING